MAQCTQLVTQTMDGAFDATYPAVTSGDVALFIPEAEGNASAAGTLSAALARDDVQQYLSNKGVSGSANVSLILENLPPGVLPDSVKSFHLIGESSVAWTRYRFCMDSIQTALEITTPPTPVTGVATYRWKYESAAWEANQTVITAFRRELGARLLCSCDSSLQHEDMMRS